MHKPNAAHKATPISPRSSPHPRPVRDQRVAATVTGESPVVPPPNTGMGSGSSGLQSWSHHNIRAALLTFLVLLTHRPTYAYGPSIRVHTSLVCGQAQQAPPVVLDLGFLRALHSHKNDSHHHHHSSNSLRRSVRNKSSPPRAVLPPIMRLASTSLGFGDTRGRLDLSALTPVMSTIDEDEHERERKRALSVFLFEHPLWPRRSRHRCAEWPLLPPAAPTTFRRLGLLCERVLRPPY
jgi:hypothetical protein